MKSSLPEGAAGLSKAVSGRDVLLIGSAPGASLYGVTPDLVATVNGAALGLSERIEPDILFLNTAVAACNLAGRPTRERLAELSAGLLVIIESGTSLADAAPVFEPIVRRERLEVPLVERTWFLETFLGRTLASPWGSANVPSTGFLACLLLLAAGARRVQMRGFGFMDGHSYLPEVFKRGHAACDQEVLSLICQRRLPVDFQPSLGAQRSLDEP
jgi:hypothetical protein